MVTSDFIKRIGAASFALVSIFSVTTIHLYSYNIARFGHVKQSSQVIKECKDLGIDYGYLKSKNNNFAILDISTDKPLVIQYDSSMPKKEINMISKAVNYCEKIFKTIDEGYDFELVSSDDADEENVVIDIKNGNEKEINNHFSDGQGLNESSYKYNINKNIIIRSEIVIDWESTQKIGDGYAYYVILHELAHSFGFGDVYYNGSHKNIDYNYGTTIMNANATRLSEFHPNDYALLQAMYSKEYLKQDSYDDAVNIMKKKIQLYEQYFYNKLAENLKSKNENYFIYEEKAVLENLSFKWERKDSKGSKCYISVDIKDGICNFVIKDDNGNVLEKSKSETIYADGILFVKSVKVDKASNYSCEESDVGCKIMFFVARNNNDQFVIQDNLYNDGEKIKVNEINNDNKR